MSGIFGVVSRENCAEILFYGIDYHSHLGTEYGGIAVLGEDFSRQIHNLSQSQFKSKFCDDYENMKGNMGIGVISDFDEQPIYLNSKFGPFCIVTSGYIENAEDLTANLLQKGISYCLFLPPITLIIRSLIMRSRSSDSLRNLSDSLNILSVPFSRIEKSFIQNGLIIRDNAIMIIVIW